MSIGPINNVNEASAIEASATTPITNPIARLEAAYRSGSYTIGIDMMAYLPLGLLGASVSVMHVQKLITIGQASTYLTIAIFASSLAFMFFTREFGLPRAIVKMSLPWLALIAIYICSETAIPSVMGLQRIGQLIAAFLFFISCSCIRWDQQFLRILAMATSIYVLEYLILYHETHFAMEARSAFDNYNPSGFMLYCVMVFQVFALVGLKDSFWRGFHILVIAVCLVIHPLCGARSVTLEILVALTLYGAWPRITRSKKLYTATLLFLYFLIVAFTIIYPIWGEYKKDYVALEKQTQVTGGNLFSGREIVWLDIEKRLLRNPLFCQGAGASYQDFSNMDVSASSLYMQIGLETGFPGIIAMFFVLGAIWMAFWPGRNSKWARIGAAVLYGIIFHQCLEICLTQNQLYVGDYMWLTVAIPLSRVLQETRVNAAISDIQENFANFLGQNGQMVPTGPGGTALSPPLGGSINSPGAA